jgi:putative transposase
MRIKLYCKRSRGRNAIHRWVQSCKVECLDHFICFGEHHLRYLPNEYLAYNHEQRPHQALDNVPLSGLSVNETATPNLENLVCEQRLGGLLKHHCRAA